MEAKNQIELLNTKGAVELLQTAPGVLQKNELSVSKCNAAGQVLIDTIEASGGRIPSDEMDADVKSYLDKAKFTVTSMNERRKPVTQILSAIAKRFTSLEGEIDPKGAGTIPYQLQVFRNEYAAWKLSEQRRREEEARRAKALEDEKISYRAYVEDLLNTAYEEYVTRKITYLERLYERVTLETHSDALREIKAMDAGFVWEDFVKSVRDTGSTVYIGPEVKKAIKNEVAGKKKGEYAQRFNFEISELKASLLDRMPSKYNALKEEAELRRKDAEAAAQAEAFRKQREAEASALAEAERKGEEESRRAKAEADRKAAEAISSLNFMNDLIPESQVKAKVAKKIQVLNPRGFIELYQFWFMKEGAGMPMADLEKIHKKMITFCEKEANREGGETIKSVFIKYVDDVKAK
jgi:hypothetical protein